MSKEVLLKAFKKAEEDIGSNKKTHLSTYLSDILEEEYGLFINERTLRNYYTNYKVNREELCADIKPRLLKPLCNYLGYKNYANFVAENSNEIETHTTFLSKARHLITLYAKCIFCFGISVLSIGLTLYHNLYKKPKNYVIINYVKNESNQNASKKKLPENIQEIDSITKKSDRIILWFDDSQND